MSDSLFNVTQDHLNKGLRGFPVGTCRTSFVDPEQGVHYVGYPIGDLVSLEAEKVVHLMVHKHLPNDSEDAAFRDDMAKRSVVPDGVIESMARLSHTAHPMDWFIAGLGFLGHTGATEDFREDGLNLIARVSEVVAATFRLRGGWGDPIPSEPERGIIGNFVNMLGVPDASEHLERVLREFYILHMDHGGGNLSTFTGKAVASGLANMYRSQMSAMAALSGTLHGRANQDCLEFVRTVGTDDHAEITRICEERINSGQVVPGFGHAVLRAEDPRARCLYALGQDVCPDDPLFRCALAMRTAVPAALQKFPKIKNPYPNVDASTGSILQAVGFKDPEFYTVLFGWSRVAGITAQIIDERHVLRGGKGVPIYRPKYIPEEQPAQRLNG